MSADRWFYTGMSILAAMVVAVIGFAVVCVVNDSDRVEKFTQRCEENGGIVLAENRWDRVCVQGNFRETDRIDR